MQALRGREVASSEELTPRPSISIAGLQLTASSLLNKIRPGRHTVAGEGLRKGGISTAELRGAPPSKGTRSAEHRHADRTSASTAPPTGLQSNPTLYTSRGSTIPRPPAAGAAAGDRGIGDPTASEVSFPESFRKSSYPTVAGEEDDQVSSFSKHLIF